MPKRRRCITMVTPTTVSSAAAVIAHTRVRAMRRNTWSRAKWPMRTTATIVPSTRTTVASPSGARPSRSRQTTARAAMLQDRREILEQQHSLLTGRGRSVNSTFSSSTCSAKTVDDATSASPAKSAVCHASPEQHRDRRERERRQASCAPPRPNGRAHGGQPLRPPSSPMNKSSTDAGSAMCRISLASLSEKTWRTPWGRG